MNANTAFKLVLLAALWGASFLFMRLATPEFGPIALIQIRVTLASIVLLPIWWIRTSPLQREVLNKHWRMVALVGCLNSAIPFVLFAFSTLYITGGFSAILNSTAPIWGALIGLIWFGRAVSKNLVTGLLIGVLGVSILVGGSVSNSTENTALVLLAIGAATFAALLYGIAANLTAEYLKLVSSLSIATFSLVAAAIILLPISVVAIPDSPISLTAWCSVIAMGVFSTAFANILYFDVLASAGSTKALTVTFMIPVFASIWGVLFIGEQVTLAMTLGGTTILLGLGFVTGLLRIRSNSEQA